MEVELARRQWADGNRRLEESRDDPARHRRLLAQVEIVIGELRRRVGQTFTLAELADVYDGADEWARNAIDEADDEPGAVHEASTVNDAAFHAYARGASDYTP